MIKKIFGTGGIALLLATTTPVFAQTATSTATSTPTNATSTATSTPNDAINVACIQNAVEKRENAMIAAVDKYMIGVKTALQTRKEELKKAWAITDRKERRKALREAWKHYGETLREAKKEYRKNVREIWKQYKEDRKECGRGVIADDKVLKIKEL